MKNILKLAVMGAALMIAQQANAQTRAVGAANLVIDDNAGHAMTISTPLTAGDPGYSNWITGGALSWKLPIPPATGASMGFVLPGTTASQVPVWDPPTASGGTGGAQGAWRPGFVTANSFSGTLPIANGGTGATTSAAALNALLPSQTGNNGKVLTTNGTTASWQTSGGGGGQAYYNTYAIKPSNASSTTNVIDGNITFTAVAGATYEVHGVLFLSSTGTSQTFTVGMDDGASGGSTNLTLFCAANLSGSNNFQDAFLQNGMGNANMVTLATGNNVNNFVIITGTVTAAANGSISLLWRGTSSMTLLANSYLNFTKVN